MATMLNNEGVMAVGIEERDVLVCIYPTML